jgi:hypothetical protein
MEHRLKADNNESFLITIENVDAILQFSDWKYIALYYSALHFGDSYLAKRGINYVRDHRDRDQKYRKNLPKGAIVAYQTLKDFSIIARYQPEFYYMLTESKFKHLYANEFQILKSLV